MNPRQAAPQGSGGALRTLFQQCRNLIEASLPVMAEARDLLARSGTIMILTDGAGVILQTEGDPVTMEAALRVPLTPGSNLNESSSGTNAVGVALSLRKPVQVHGAEHSDAGLKSWTCSATPVRDPSNGDILGVLDVSGLQGTANHHSLALAVSAAGRIEARLTAHELELRQRLLEWGLTHLADVASAGLLFFDRKGRLITAEPRASSALAAMGVAPDLKSLAHVGAFDSTLAAEARAPEPPGWLRPEWIELVVEDSDRLGTVVVLPPVAKPASPHPPSLAAPGAGAFDSIIGGSEAITQAVQKAQVLAPVDVPVLLHGETGVGKEIFARALHEGGRRKAGPFVALNCGGLPRELLASELFGYSYGAFTGARRGGMIGKVEAAQGGTLFLDEIGEMPLELQPYLLRVLDAGMVQPLGDHKPRKVDFRLVVATNRDLRAEIAAGRFRMDLFYRISVMSVRIPPLRERRDDIAALASHFASETARKHIVPAKPLGRDVLDALQRYDWPGNVRELHNVVEGMLLVARGDEVTLANLPAEITVPGGPMGSSCVAPGGPASLEEVERDAIRRMIAASQGNLTAVAKELGVSKSTLYLKVRKYALDDVVDGARLVRRRARLPR